MLACNVDLKKLRYPVIVQPKIDGIRAIKWKGQLISRTGKPIPNKYIQKTYRNKPEGVDGELICDDFNKTTSIVMSKDRNEHVNYKVFDRITEGGYFKRVKDIFSIDSHIADNLDDVIRLERMYLGMGYEGIILRYPEAKYKFGRSTQCEGGLMKLKRFKDSEAEVIGFEEEVDKDGKLKGILGSLMVKDKVIFNIGTGFTLNHRKEIWNNKNRYRGSLVKYKYTDSVKDKPRFPVFLGIRDRIDI